MKGAPDMKDAIGTRLAAVIGHPVAHSLSPRLFTLLSAELHGHVVYKAIDIAPSDLASRVESESRTRAFTGWNVTAPHKKSVLTLAERVSPLARVVGAANVLHFTDAGIEAHNTDVYGVARTLQEQQFDPISGAALVLGAGGAARAVACALAQAGAPAVLVWNRSPVSARTLCTDMAAQFPRTAFRSVTSMAEVDRPLTLLVNATSVGLQGNPGSLPCPSLGPGALAFDVVYATEPTAFLREAASHGARTVDGLDMLTWQALATWELWFGPIANAAELKRFVRKSLREEA